MNLSVAICITTHNRCTELKRALDEIGKLDPPPDEIIVVADGCSDGTAAFVRASHPRVSLIEHDRPRGSVPSRNEMAAATRCDVFVSLDDDSHPIEADFIARVRTLFSENARLAVASFPQRTDERPETLTQTDFGDSHFVGSYANSAAAIRRSVFRELGGYPDFFFHMYEEPDFALRCVAAGWEVRFETAVTVRHHFAAAQRNEIRVHQRHARNELWSVLMRCPAPQLCAVAAFRAARQFGYAWHRGFDWAAREPQWWLAFFRGIPRCLAARAPVPWARYAAWMRLLRAPIHDPAEWAARFRPAAR
ncbi:MAG TPA: glycosyltransferase [Chthoniobacteraceae bacterium]|nr:glycosyltransferase [Chthoniobacteraceae bacterium]